jgi:hypothetical protein
MESSEGKGIFVDYLKYELDIKEAMARIDALGVTEEADLEERAMLYLDISHLAKIAKLCLALEYDPRPGPDYYARRKERNDHWRAISDRLIDTLAERQEAREQQQPIPNDLRVYNPATGRTESVTLDGTPESERKRRELLGLPTLN